MSCPLGNNRLGCTGAVVGGSRRVVIGSRQCAAIGDNRQGAIVGDGRRCAVIGGGRRSDILSRESYASHKARASREVTSRDPDTSTEVSVSGIASGVRCLGGAVLVIGLVGKTSLGVVIVVVLALLVIKLVFGKSQSRSESEVDRRCGQDILANHVD